MRSTMIKFLLGFPLVLVSSLPLNSTEVLSRRAPHPIHTCTCNGRHYADVYGTAVNAAHFSNHERLNLGHCPNPMTRWVLSYPHGDRAVYSGNNFCACITHEGFTTPQNPNAFGLC